MWNDIKINLHILFLSTTTLTETPVLCLTAAMYCRLYRLPNRFLSSGLSLTRPDTHPRLSKCQIMDFVLKHPVDLKMKFMSNDWGVRCTKHHQASQFAFHWQWPLNSLASWSFVVQACVMHVRSQGALWKRTYFPNYWFPNKISNTFYAKILRVQLISWSLAVGQWFLLVGQHRFWKS